MLSVGYAQAQLARRCGRIFCFATNGISNGWQYRASHKRSVPFLRGEEKSVFKFGGSAVVLFGEKAALLPSSDITAYTRKGIEALVRLGDVIAASPQPDAAT
jgi:hypothetical protein